MDEVQQVAAKNEELMDYWNGGELEYRTILTCRMSPYPSFHDSHTPGSFTKVKLFPHPQHSETA